MTDTRMDPVVVTNRYGRARLLHDLGHAPALVMVRIGDGATEMQSQVARFVVEDFDAQSVGFRAYRLDTGGPLTDAALPVRLSVA